MSEPIDLDAIEARADAATAGAWRVWSGTRPYDEAAVETAWAYEGDEEVELVTDCCSVADAEFIAHSRTDVPALTARVRELEAYVSQFENCAKAIENVFGTVTWPSTTLRSAINRWKAGSA